MCHFLVQRSWKKMCLAIANMKTSLPPLSSSPVHYWWFRLLCVWWVFRGNDRNQSNLWWFWAAGKWKKRRTRCLCAVSFRFWFFRVLSPCPTVMFTFMSKLKRSTCPATWKYWDHALSVQYCRCKFECGCKHTQCASPVLSVYSLLLECHLL